MDSVIEFFGDISTTFRAIVLMGGLVFFWVLEGFFPLFSNKSSRYGHAGINLVFTSMTMLVGFGFAGMLLWISNFTSSNSIGLLYLYDFPLWCQMILGVLLMDLIGAYFVHWVEHKVKWMWKFHLVHHSDADVDVTTGLRHHPGEIVFRIMFTAMAVFVIGAPMWIIMLYQSLSVLSGHLTHANITVPKKLDTILSLVFVTPLMHKVHHHYKQPFTDTNYGNIFSIWDRVFGTFATVENTKQLVYGIDTHMAAEENASLSNLLQIPFQKYRAPENSKFGGET